MVKPQNNFFSPWGPKTREQLKLATYKIRFELYLSKPDVDVRSRHCEKQIGIFFCYERLGTFRHRLHGCGFVCNRIDFDAATPSVYTAPRPCLKPGRFENSVKSGAF